MQPLEALREALAGWRKTKHPRFADVAKWATIRALAAEPARPLVGDGGKKADFEAWLALLGEQDPLDLTRLLAVVGRGRSADAIERVVLLSKLNDPRVTDGLLALLSAPPYRARTALPFFRACAKALHDSGDPRVRAALEELAGRYKSILETSVGDDVIALLRRTAESLDQVKPGPLPAAQEKRCAALEALFEVERVQTARGAAKQQTARHDDDALLAAIYASPDDDTPRMVFADALSERGDLRGEFIALQLARARGGATPAQLKRERELCGDAKRRAAWGLPLSQGAACHLARGFPDELTLEPRSFKSLVGLPAVRTVRTVGGFERDVSLKQAKAFLTHEVAARLSEVKGITSELFETLEGPLPWTTVALRFSPSRLELSRLPGVKDLQVGAGGAELTPQTFEGMARLEKLRLNRANGETLAPLVGLTELHVAAWLEDFDWARELSRLPKLSRLVTGSAPRPARLEGLRLEALDCHPAPHLDPDGLIRALPQLRELRVARRGSEVRAVLAKLLSSERFRQLRFASIGSFDFLAPWTKDGTLELRTWSHLNVEAHAESLAQLPEGCVSRVLLRPIAADPWANAGITPAEAAVEALRGVAKVPVELAWY
mgnify:CR=1 FL=1